MKTIIMTGLAILSVIAGGLLLGGNVIAESGEGSVAATQSESEQVQLLEEKARMLSEQVRQFLEAETIAQVEETVQETDKEELTQEDLDRIEVQVKEVAAKTEVLKGEVAKYVLVRDVTAKIAYLKGEVDKLKLAEVTGAEVTGTVLEGQPLEEGQQPESSTGVAQAPEAPVVSEATPGNSGEVESQIAAIKEQIKELTSEYETQKAAEDAAAAATQQVEEQECKDGVCSASVETTPAQTAATTETTSSNKGFWATVSDFLKNLFTF